MYYGGKWSCHGFERHPKLISKAEFVWFGPRNSQKLTQTTANIAARRFLCRPFLPHSARCNTITEM